MLRGHFREMFAADAPFRTFKTAFVRLLAVNKKEGKRWYDLLKISLLMINLWPSFLKNQLFFHYIIINCIKENRTRSYHLWPLTLVIYTKFSNTLIIQPLTTRRVLKTYKIDNIFYNTLMYIIEFVSFFIYLATIESHRTREKHDSHQSPTVPDREYTRAITRTGRSPL